jgi:hypothetical protein
VQARRAIYLEALSAHRCDLLCYRLDLGDAGRRYTGEDKRCVVLEGSARALCAAQASLAHSCVDALVIFPSPTLSVYPFLDCAIYSRCNA